MKINQNWMLVRLFLSRDTWISVCVACAFIAAFHFSCNVTILVNANACYFAGKMKWFSVCMTGCVYFYFWLRRFLNRCYRDRVFYFFKEIGVLVFGWCVAFSVSSFVELSLYCFINFILN